jgi:hypothetical protein
MKPLLKVRSVSRSHVSMIKEGLTDGTELGMVFTNTLHRMQLHVDLLTGS